MVATEKDQSGLKIKQMAKYDNNQMKAHMQNRYITMKNYLLFWKWTFVCVELRELSWVADLPNYSKTRKTGKWGKDKQGE